MLRVKENEKELQNPASKLYRNEFPGKGARNIWQMV